MKLTEQQTKNIETLLKTKGLRKNFPFLHQIIKEEMLEDGTTYKFDNWGFCRELSDEQKKKVEAIEKDQAKYNTKVLFVLESIMQIDGEKFEMTNYIIYNDEDVRNGLDLDTEQGVLRCLAMVQSPLNYGDDELGYILVREVVGTMRRVG